ncbi:MAG: flagellar export protein FliJ [Betaproteobacteria bacterium]|jgi:flagellar FliJ protein|nr:flagellar export protein FliJ [Betaproteobacteria bacterium]
MPFNTPLDILLDAARRQCDGEARRLAEDLAQARASEERLELLERYRHDYEMRLREKSSLGLTAEAWRNYRIFMGQLDVAMQAQRADIAGRKQASQARRDAWSAARQRVRTFERLVERRVEEARVAGDRRDQNASDEQAARRAGASRNAPR